MTDTPWMNAKEAAVYLRVSQRQVARLIKDRGLPFDRIGRRLIFHRDKIDKWIEQT